MKRRWRFLILISLLIFTGCDKNSKKSEEITTTPNPTEVVNSVEVWGEVVSEKKKAISVDFPSRVEHIPIKVGQTIKKGEILLSLTYDEYKLKIAQKKKELELEEAKLQGNLKNTSVQSQEINDLKGKKSELEKTVNPELKRLESDKLNYIKTLEKEKKELEAQQAIFDIGGIAKKQLEEYKDAVTQSEKAILDTQYAIERITLNHKNEIKDLEDKINQKSTQLSLDATGEVNAINQQKIRVEIVKLELKELQGKLSRDYLVNGSIISTLEEGIVTAIHVQEGGNVGLKGSEVVVELLESHNMLIRADVPEEFITSIKVGKDASIIPYSDKTKTLKGKVLSIADAAVKENGETIIKVDIAVDEKSELIKPGLSVDVEIVE